MGLEKMQGTVVALNSQFELGLGSEDGVRLFAYLGGSEGCSLEFQQEGAVTKQRFVQGVLDLSELLHRVSDKITLPQMKVVLMHAFDQFDLDGDSSISVEELATATRNFGLELGRDDVAHLHRFLAPSGSMEIVPETSSSFCFPSNSSFSASWFLSSQSRVSCTAFSIFSLSPPSNLSFSFSSFKVLRMVKQ